MYMYIYIYICGISLSFFQKSLHVTIPDIRYVSNKHEVAVGVGPSIKMLHVSQVCRPNLRVPKSIKNLIFKVGVLLPNLEGPQPQNNLMEMGVSKNRGTPKWMVYMENPIKMDDLGIPKFLETPKSSQEKTQKNYKGEPMNASQNH